MFGRELYLKGRDLLYRGLLASDRLFYRPDAAAEPSPAGWPRTVAVLVPVNTPEGSIAFSRAKLLVKSLRALDCATRWVRFRSEPRRIGELARELTQNQTDLVLIPGSFDVEQEGLPQLLLELIGVRHTGSDAVTARLCADKLLTKRLAGSVGVATAPWSVATAAETARPPAGTDYPVIVKPRSGTNSIGVHLAHDGDELGAAVTAVRRIDSTALIEARLMGQEVTVGVLADPQPRALGVVGFAPGVLATAEKTRAGEGIYQEPAELPAAAIAATQRAAEQMFIAAGCRGVARIDFIWADEQPWLLEINAVPGLFPRGTLAASARLAGLDTPALLRAIIADACR